MGKEIYRIETRKDNATKQYAVYESPQLVPAWMLQLPIPEMKRQLLEASRTIDRGLTLILKRA